MAKSKNKNIVGSNSKMKIYDANSSLIKEVSIRFDLQGTLPDQAEKMVQNALQALGKEKEGYTFSKSQLPEAPAITQRGAHLSEKTPIYVFSRKETMKPIIKIAYNFVDARILFHDIASYAKFTQTARAITNEILKSNPASSLEKITIRACAYCYLKKNSDLKIFFSNRFYESSHPKFPTTIFFASQEMFESKRIEYLIYKCLDSGIYKTRKMTRALIDMRAKISDGDIILRATTKQSRLYASILDKLFELYCEFLTPKFLESHKIETAIPEDKIMDSTMIANHGARHSARQ